MGLSKVTAKTATINPGQSPPTQNIEFSGLDSAAKFVVLTEVGKGADLDKQHGTVDGGKSVAITLKDRKTYRLQSFTGADSSGDDGDGAPLDEDSVVVGPPDGDIQVFDLFGQLWMAAKATADSLNTTIPDRATLKKKAGGLPFFNDIYPALTSDQKNMVNGLIKALPRPQHPPSRLMTDAGWGQGVQHPGTTSCTAVSIQIMKYWGMNDAFRNAEQGKNGPNSVGSSIDASDKNGFQLGDCMVWPFFNSNASDLRPEPGDFIFGRAADLVGTETNSTKVLTTRTDPAGGIAAHIGIYMGGAGADDSGQEYAFTADGGQGSRTDQNAAINLRKVSYGSGGDQRIRFSSLSQHQDLVIGWLSLKLVAAKSGARGTGSAWPAPT